MLLIEKEKIVPEALKTINDYVEFSKNLDKKQIVYLEKQDLNFIDLKTVEAKRNGYNFNSREVNFYRSTIELCVQEIIKARENMWECDSVCVRV